MARHFRGISKNWVGRWNQIEGKIHSQKDMLSNVAAAEGVLCSGEKGASKNWAVGQLSDRGPSWGSNGEVARRISDHSLCLPMWVSDLHGGGGDAQGHCAPKTAHQGGAEGPWFPGRLASRVRSNSTILPYPTSHFPLLPEVATSQILFCKHLTGVQGHGASQTVLVTHRLHHKPPKPYASWI